MHADKFKQCGFDAFRAILTALTMHAVESLLLFVIGPTLFAFTRRRIPAIPALWALMAYCLFILLRFGSPGAFLQFPRSNPGLWFLVTILYPVLSVYPQGI